LVAPNIVTDSSKPRSNEARAIGETRGFMKMLLDVDGDRILGFTMLGADAGEVLAVVQTAMLAGLPYTRLRDAILTHPTMAEGLNVLLTSVPPDASLISTNAATAHCTLVRISILDESVR
jgi:hypothetical protein